jgi:hypothetical protein
MEVRCYKSGLSCKQVVLDVRQPRQVTQAVGALEGRCLVRISADHQLFNPCEKMVGSDLKSGQGRLHAAHFQFVTVWCSSAVDSVVEAVCPYWAGLYLVNYFGEAVRFCSVWCLYCDSIFGLNQYHCRYSM